MKNLRPLLIIFFIFLSISTSQAQNKRFFAIVPFTNSSPGGSEWVGRGIEEILYDKFSNLKHISAYEKETFLRILKRNGINDIQDLNARKAFTLGKETGVDVILGGEYQVTGDDLLINFKVISTYTGATIFNRSFAGKLENIYDVHEDAILAILETLEIPLSDSEKDMLARSSTSSSQAFESYCKAYIAFQSGASMDIVANYFTQAITNDPDFWEAQYNLGVIYYNYDQYERALAQFEKVIQRNPSFYKPYYGKGVIFYLQGKLQQAKASFEKVLNREPDNDRTLYYLGRVYVRQDSIEKGLEYLNQSVEINPNYAPTHYQIGLANMRRDWYKTAVKALRDAIKLNPSSYNAHNALGECYYRLQRFDDAVFHYQKAIDLKKDFSTAYFNLGNTIYRRGALEEIVDAYLDILETRYSQDGGQSANQEILQDLKSLRTSETDRSGEIYTGMVKAYRNAIKYEPGFYEAAFNLGLTYENMGRLDSAKYFYEQALQGRSDLVRAHMRLGRIFEKEGQYSEALNHFKEVVKIEPSYFAATPRLGEEYRYINIVEEVLKEYQLKQELNPNDPEVLIVLARIYNSLGRLGQAQEYYEQIVQMQPNNPEANRALKSIKRHLREL